MTSEVKKIISILATAVILAVAFIGNYLPYRKSAAFISGNREAQQVKTLVEFKEAMDKSLLMYSPIGQNELVRNLGSSVMTVVRGASQNPELISATMEYLNGYYAPIIERGKGPSFSQDLYLLGIINESAFLNTRDVRYLYASEAYYKEGYARGPKRPQFLYGLFDIYTIEESEAGAEGVTGEILSYWPSDENIIERYEKFKAHMTSAAKK